MADKKAVVAGKAPIPVEVEAGKAYFWCTCGLPQKWEAPESRTVYFCACKQTAGAPLCDGTHNKL
jgi:CDGSH-type Zn-finger protein